MKSTPYYQIKMPEAVITMVDSNLQREHILPSEKAFAYKMKMEALKSQGKRTDLTLSQVATKLDVAKEIGKQSGESRDQVFRYIRLTNLIPAILKLVDEGRIALTPAVELSYLNSHEQNALYQIQLQKRYGHFGRDLTAEYTTAARSRPMWSYLRAVELLHDFRLLKRWLLRFSQKWGYGAS